jgi:hypothetical protein
MSSEAGLESHQARWKAGEKSEDLTSSYLPPEHGCAVGVGTVNLKYVLRDIESNDCDGGHV